MKNGLPIGPENPDKTIETENPEFEKFFQELQNIINVLTEMGFTVPEYCFSKKHIQEQWNNRFVFPIVREGLDGIRASISKRNGSIMVSFTNGFEDPQNPDRLKVTKKLREAGFDVR